MTKKKSLKFYSIKSRLVYYAEVTVEAENEDDAECKFRSGEFSVSRGTEDLVDWESHSTPREEK